MGVGEQVTAVDVAHGGSAVLQDPAQLSRPDDTALPLVPAGSAEVAGIDARERAVPVGLVVQEERLHRSPAQENEPVIAPQSATLVSRVTWAMRRMSAFACSACVLVSPGA